MFLENFDRLRMTPNRDSHVVMFLIGKFHPWLSQSGKAPKSFVPAHRSPVKSLWSKFDQVARAIFTKAMMSDDDHAYAVNPIVSDSVQHNARVCISVDLSLSCLQILIQDPPTDLIQHSLPHISTSRRRCWRPLSRINKWLSLLPSRHDAGLALDLLWAHSAQTREILWSQLRHETQPSHRTGETAIRRWHTRT